MKLQIWDTAGQERFKTITSAYYRGSHGIMLVFDKTDRASFENIPNWIEEINKFSESSVRVLVGNKDDCKETRQIEFEEGHTYASMSKMDYVETSALDSHQITQAFEIMARQLIHKNKKPLMEKNDAGEKLGEIQKKALGGCCVLF